MRWESMVARERRYEATAVRAVGDLQSSVAVLQRSVQSVKRELERVLAGVPAPAAAGATRAPVASGRRPGAPPAPPSQIHGGLDSCKYVGFEDQFRGSEGEIRARLSEYAGLFDGARDVLDVGCGRGEFLEILRDRGVNARGLDINHEMVEVCRGRGLDVAEGDALDYLASLADESLGGLLAAQVVEHLAPEYLVRLLEVASHKLRPGAAIVLETINPACWAAFFESYIRDITHVRPLHPETLKYLLVASGFHQVEVRYRAPYPDHAKLQPVPIPSAGPPGRSESALAELAATFNANVEKINGLLFTYFDYAAIGRRA
jgi:O-antigen chain-terminating methyltransferase